jgi:hypothetical protein
MWNIKGHFFEKSYNYKTWKIHKEVKEDQITCLFFFFASDTKLWSHLSKFLSFLLDVWQIFPFYAVLCTFKCTNMLCCFTYYVILIVEVSTFDMYEYDKQYLFLSGLLKLNNQFLRTCGTVHKWIAWHCHLLASIHSLIHITGKLNRNLVFIVFLPPFGMNIILWNSD